MAGAIFKHLDDGQWIWSTLAVLGGFHTLNDAAGCSNLWFVYSLIIIKLVYQTAGKKTNLAKKKLISVASVKRIRNNSAAPSFFFIRRLK